MRSAKHAILLSFIFPAIALSALWWWYKGSSTPKAQNKQRKKDLELLDDTKTTLYLCDIANDINSSENAVNALASDSDEFVTPSSSASDLLDDQSESQVPVNFLPTAYVEFTVTSTHYFLWVEYGTCDYY